MPSMYSHTLHTHFHILYIKSQPTYPAYRCAHFALHSAHILPPYTQLTYSHTLHTAHILTSYMSHIFSHPTCHTYSHTLHTYSRTLHTDDIFSHPTFCTHYQTPHAAHILIPYTPHIFSHFTYFHTLQNAAHIFSHPTSATLACGRQVQCCIAKWHHTRTLPLYIPPAHTYSHILHTTWHHTYAHTLHWLVAVAVLHFYAHTLTPYIPFRHTYSHTLHTFPNTDSHTLHAAALTGGRKVLCYIAKFHHT